MPRIARVVVPSLPHHVTQRGSRNQRVFFSDEDKENYLIIFREEVIKHDLEIWAYCLMDNHVHFIVVPKDRDSLAKTFREAHKRYARMINQREGWRGHLWQERFHSFVMDEKHLYAAVRYVENNPLKANIVKNSEDYPWSSARSHTLGITDPLLSPCFVTEQIPNWADFLSSSDEPVTVSHIETQVRTGRPYGSVEFLGHLEQTLGYRIQRLPAGRKRRK